MSLLREIRHRGRYAAGRVLCVCIMVYAGYHAYEGERGLKAWWRVTGELDAARAEQSKAKAERDRLGHRVGLLRRESLDTDMLDERVRLMLNLARPDEIIILYGDKLTDQPAPQRRPR